MITDCTMWFYWGDFNLHGTIDNEPSFSTLSNAQTRCHELGPDCTAVTTCPDCNDYVLVSSQSQPLPSKTGWKTWMKAVAC